MPQVGPSFDRGNGDRAETVLLGCMVGEHLRLWRADGRAECVRVLHPSELHAHLARGLAPRVKVEPERFREVGRFDGERVLLLGRRPFAVEVCGTPPASDALWRAAAEVFQEAAADAIARGEFLVLEPGGSPPGSHTYALAAATRTPGEWLLRVEAVPAPRAPSWPEPPEGQAGWGVAAPAEPETRASLGVLLADAVAMWAGSPLDVAFTFATSPDGAWPPVEVPAAIEQLLAQMRAEIEELHATRQLSGARLLSARTETHFNHNTYPVYFTGDLRSRLVLVHHNPHQRANPAETYEGGFEYDDFAEYLEHHRRFGHWHWEIGDEQPSPIDYKQMRFLRHWGVIDLPAGAGPEEQRASCARAVDERLQLELIPYGSPRFPSELPREVLAPHYERLMRVITAYPRDYVIVCGPALESVLAPYIVDRDDHTFRLPTSTGISRVGYRFSNLLLELDGATVRVGLAPHFSSPGVPMDAYGEACRERYRTEGPVRSVG